MGSISNLSVNKVAFIKHHAWYLSIVEVEGKKGCYWSHHDRNGLTDKEAEKAFKFAHFREVQALINKQINSN